MRNFSWSCFQVTGSIDAYLLYKDMEAITVKKEDDQLEDVEQNEEAK
ncbi:YqzL family protein [Shimazuella alba]|uniref:YqzL family protein n=1 Tax=Shimazuella alba TaxID=2690964 RepID=A0A6I4VV01_9BACL|nr:YqzL family protein [Shimazuella alba]